LAFWRGEGRPSHTHFVILCIISNIVVTAFYIKHKFSNEERIFLPIHKVCPHVIAYTRTSPSPLQPQKPQCHRPLQRTIYPATQSITRVQGQETEKQTDLPSRVVYPNPAQTMVLRAIHHPLRVLLGKDDAASLGVPRHDGEGVQPRQQPDDFHEGSLLRRDAHLSASLLSAFISALIVRTI
jgi:hypothetical protein